MKKYKNNEYVKTKSGVWVRDPTKTSYPIDINNFSTAQDYQLFMQNEIKLKSFNPMMLDDLKVQHKNCVIISDGFDFKNKQTLLSTIQQNYTIIGINGSLRKWNLKISPMHYYVVNNPYPECCAFLPSFRYFPTCILASRTNPDFVRKYKGNLIRYIPTYEENFSGMEKKYNFKIDDYRNPMCAAINIAKYMGAENILLFCCDSSFSDERKGSIKLKNGLSAYAKHQIGYEIADEIANFIKLDDEYINIGDFSNGYDYTHIDKISENELSTFFDNSIT